MATFSNASSANSTTSGATLDLTTITAAIGDFLVLAVAADNAGTAGVSSTSATITDAAGNTWTRRSETNMTQVAAANDGTTLGLWTCNVTATLTSATITVNFSPNTTSKAAVLKKIVPDGGKAIAYNSVGAGATGTGTAWDAPTVSVPLAQTIFGATAAESITIATADSDTTNGSWSADQTASASTGVVTTSQIVGLQFKTVTATGNQSYGRVAGNSRDWAMNWLIIEEYVSGTLGATEAADVAAFTASHGWEGILAATETPDTAVFLGVDGPVGFLAATERPDRAVFSIVPVWSDVLPTPTLQGYSFRAAAAVERREMEIGSARVYRRTRKPVIEVTVAWNLDEADQALLDGFQTSVLQQGTHTFGIELALPGGVSLAVARFKGPVAMRALGGPRWMTTATLELLTRPVMSDADLTTLLDDDGDPPQWPTDLLPYPTLDGYVLTPKPATVHTADDLPGLPYARHRSFNSMTELPATWELTVDQAALFDAFFVHRAKEGAQWFEFPLTQAIGTIDTMVRFLGDADWSPRAGGRWAVTAPIEIRERRVLSADEVADTIQGMS